MSYSDEQVRILVLIPYPSDRGVAIGRLVQTSFRAISQVAARREDIHGCLKRKAEVPCRFLPEGFR